MKTGSDRHLLHQFCSDFGAVLSTSAPNQLLLQVRESDMLLKLAERIKNDDFYLVTVVANDERELEDKCLKIYYIFSHPSKDLFLIAEYLLEPGKYLYPSIHKYFQAVDPFEREILDLFGLVPSAERGQFVSAGSWLHAVSPPNLYPLRRDQTTSQIKQTIAACTLHTVESGPSRIMQSPGQGIVFMPVGPVHTTVIESGGFIFQISGEVIDDLNIRLGYKHKGIERLFQARMTIADGWQLAEQVSGDSAFAHSLAYCLAAEALAGVEPPEEAQLLRGLFLELERIYNHVGDTAGLAQDAGMELIASEISVVREELLRLNARIAGHRLLHGLNRPGGIWLPRPLDGKTLASTLATYLNRFTAMTQIMAGIANFRDRAINTGILRPVDALAEGATGLVARASGISRDYRCDHPSGIYRQPWLHKRFKETTEKGAGSSLINEARRGDVYARFLQRVQEVRISTSVIRELLERWDSFATRDGNSFVSKIHFAPESNYTFGIGYAEGWRGDVVYWLMQDKSARIYRCKVRDPSVLNWPALRRAILPRLIEGERSETILADFPLINKSFNLSYSGNDL